ncbi:MAG: ATP-binding cassette domain-containing protein [Melioribacteraceae bacterium]|nr:ATP-binding cassette domain-containing protein [Melioribacteraceae bacterium]MCF8265912.1 ATP-binding cassette domain-containing protein [Melioribacteraceae bacterium]MCF8412940.1 ATP-binding cassette domain-containing protein [Melioribacteraceae bacterium]
MIKLEQVEINFNGDFRIPKLSLEFEEGSTSVLIGPSGCGKSTILRSITGLIKTDAGAVHVDGQTLTSENLNIIRRKIGYVIQSGGLFPHLTVEQNISITNNNFNYSDGLVKTKIKELSDLTKFPLSALERFPAQLSGGQRQRVSLMRALFYDPKYLLLDEPLGALDPLIRYDLQNELKEIFKKLNKTVVMVTHDLNEAIYFADKIIILKEGEIEQTGNPEFIIRNPVNEFVTKFITAQRPHK